MNRHQNDELDHDLGCMLRPDNEDDAIVPSFGFTERVMEAVKETAAAPPPLAFPWKLALPAFGTAFSILAYALLHFLRELNRMPRPESFDFAVKLPGSSGWIALALLVALLSAIIGLRFALPGQKT